MNCTVCQKPIEEHGEGIATNECIEEKLGLRWHDVPTEIRE